MVPKVAINGGSFAKLTSNPFERPNARQQTMVMSTAIKGVTPLVMSVALIIVLIPTTDPMERSMFPVIRTYDCPMPIRRIGAICLKRFATLRDEKNMGFMMPNTMHSRIRPTVTVKTCPIPLIANSRFKGLFKAIIICIILTLSMLPVYFQIELPSPGSSLASPLPATRNRLSYHRT
ncbi:hypothetical protein SDC9_73770 [bioreactor metagenome]|uniref:Uncharacterized protein n=1 Tax=bioreactor metagenome TaxID=1076179 RepID=A0A644YFP3_9ZZZZ